MPTTSAAFQAIRPDVVKAKAANDWARVAVLLEPVTQKSGGDWPVFAHVNRAQALQKLNNMEAAAAAYAVIRDKWPDELNGWRGGAEVARARKAWTEAAKLWDGCILRFPDQQVSLWWANLANALRNLGRLDEAAEAFAGTRDRWPEDVAGWRGGAESASKREDWHSAAVLWADCLARFPDLETPLWLKNLAAAQRNLDRIPEATASYAALRSRFPDDAIGWRGGAEMAARQRNWAEAEAMWQQCIARFPDQQNINWWIALSAVQLRQGRKAEAAATFARMRALWPQDATGLTAEARAAEAAANWPAAARAWGAAAASIDLAADPDLLAGYGAALIRAGRFDAATAQIDLFQTLYPNDGRWIENRVELLRARGDARAVIGLVEALSSHPAFGATLTVDSLALLAYEAGMPTSEAAVWLGRWADPETAQAAVAAKYYLPVGAILNDDQFSADKFAARSQRNWPTEYHRTLRGFLRLRTATRFELFVNTASSYATPEQVQKLLEVAIHRFPRSRVRLQLEGLLSRRAIPASDPDEAFTSRWRNLLPDADASITAQIAGRPFRRLVCALVVNNEDELLPQFVRHHARLGVESFIIVNNNSIVPPRVLLAEMTDIEITHVEAPFSFVRARHGMSWINEILEAGICDWLLFADGDELMMYPGSDTLPLSDLLDHMDARGETAFQSLMLDAYDTSFLTTGAASGDVAAQTITCAAYALSGSVRPPWRGLVNKSRPAGIFSPMPNKATLVKASAGVRFTGNHTITACTVAETTGALTHLKLLRDRDLFSLSAEEVAQHARVKDRTKSEVEKHVAMSRAVADATYDHAFHIQITEDRLLRLGYTSADADWQRRLGRPLPADRTKGIQSRRSFAPFNGRPTADALVMLDADLREVLNKIRHLANAGHRDDIRTMLNAHLARIGRREVALAMVMFTAAVLGRDKQMQRLLDATKREIARAGSASCVGALCIVADAMDDRAKQALDLLNAVAAQHKPDPRLARRRAMMLVDIGKCDQALTALEGVVPTERDGTIFPYLRALGVMRDWDKYCLELAALLKTDGIRPSFNLLGRINVCPHADRRQDYLTTLRQTIERNPEGMTDRENAIYLAVLHLLGQTTALSEAFDRLQHRLPTDSRRYFRRVVAANAGAKRGVSVWGLGLAKTGTSSLHAYCEDLGLLSAHWNNPITYTLLDPSEVGLFDILCDSSVVHMARRDGLPPGVKTILTTREFDGWAKSFNAHFGRNIGAPGASFDELKRLIDSDTLFNYGRLWSDIQIELYFRFRDLREAYDYHTGWVEDQMRAGVPLALVPLEKPDEIKARTVAGFLGIEGPIPRYPHSNRAK